MRRRRRLYRCDCGEVCHLVTIFTDKHLDGEGRLVGRDTIIKVHPAAGAPLWKRLLIAWRYIFNLPLCSCRILP